ncbi:MAG: helix-turn-helix transcriptional regulator [Fimbriimonadaceae bacterium]|nr:helix-turn-helix transcriptional regulator [Fimbriimonadaceae bacterium]
MAARELLGAHRIDVEAGGFVTFDVQLTNSKHKHDYYELCVVLGGSGNYEHGNRKFDLRPGTVFLSEPGVVHEITSFETRDLHLYFVSMSVNRLGTDVKGFDDTAVGAFLAGHLVAKDGFGLLGSYAPLIADSEGREAFSSRLLVQFALEAMRALTIGEVQSGASEPLADFDLAVAYIEKHLDRRLSLGEVARAVGVSDRTLRRRFSERAGSSFVDEVNHRRMRRAAHRLLMGFGVGEVAEYAGFSDPGQFTRAFTRAFGIAPKRFQTTYLPGTMAKRTRPDQSDL